MKKTASYLYFIFMFIPYHLLSGIGKIGNSAEKTADNISHVLFKLKH